MDKRLLRLKQRSENILSSSTRPDKKIAFSELLETWQALEKRGVPAFDFAHAALLIAEGVMITYDNLEELEAFGEYMKECGSSIVRGVRDHWPPVDPKKWPEQPPEWLSKQD